MAQVTVLLVTPWQTTCGIAEFARHLVAEDTGIYEVVADLHPQVVLDRIALPPILVLNYQAALLSQWQPSHIKAVQARGSRVVVIYHDSGVPNTNQCKALHAVADAFVVHEPVDDLPGALYWRQGVPAPRHYDWTHWLSQPVLGSIGFPFPWKNYDLLAEATAEAGWALLLIAPNATGEQVERWTQLNPALSVHSNFVSQARATSLLSSCTATAFLYTCAFGGTSGAVRQGIATRRPVLVGRGCRQMRDLELDPLAREVLTWCDPTVEGLVRALDQVRPGIHPGMVHLAHRDSWAQLRAKYRTLYTQLLEG